MYVQQLPDAMPAEYSLVTRHLPLPRRRPINAYLIVLRAIDIIGEGSVATVCGAVFGLLDKAQAVGMARHIMQQLYGGTKIRDVLGVIHELADAGIISIQSGDLCDAEELETDIAESVKKKLIKQPGRSEICAQPVVLIDRKVGMVPAQELT